MKVIQKVLIVNFAEICPSNLGLVSLKLAQDWMIKFKKIDSVEMVKSVWLLPIYMRSMAQFHRYLHFLGICYCLRQTTLLIHISLVLPHKEIDKLHLFILITDPKSILVNCLPSAFFFNFNININVHIILNLQNSLYNITTLSTRATLLQEKGGLVNFI